MGLSAIGLNDIMLRIAVRSLKTEIHRLPAWQQRDSVGNAQSRLETRFSKSLTEMGSSWGAKKNKYLYQTNRRWLRGAQAHLDKMLCEAGRWKDSRLRGPIRCRRALVVKGGPRPI